MDKVKKLILSMIIVFMATPLYAAKVLEPILIPATEVLEPIPVSVTEVLEPIPVSVAEVLEPIPVSVTEVLKPVPVINYAEDTGFCDWVNSTKKDTKDDADTLRAEWKQALGVDIFFAHFKAQEITHKIEEKAQFKLFSMRGRAKIKTDSAIYTFSHKF